METYENLELKTPDREAQRPEYRGTYAHMSASEPEIKNKGLYIIIPALLVAIAEFLIYSGKIIPAMEVHAVLLIGLCFSMLYIKKCRDPEDLSGFYPAANPAAGKSLNASFL